MEKYIYLSIASFAHEGYDVLRAFGTEKAAQKHCGEIEKYEEGRRECPGLGEPDEIWDKFYEWQQDFRENHPAGLAGYNADEYSVIKVAMAK